MPSILVLLCYFVCHVFLPFLLLQKGQQCDDAAEEGFLPHSTVHWEFGTVRTCSILKRHLKKLMMC